MTFKKNYIIFFYLIYDKLFLYLFIISYSLSYNLL
nr:MAG TPA: hypothetical protein [Caudoviricetes sp.]